LNRRLLSSDIITGLEGIMKWESLTAPDFEKAVQETGVCLLPLGILERHGNHLPLGTDLINVMGHCERAAEIEPAVVFPHFYFGQIYEAKCHPGTVTLPPVFLVDLILKVIDEIGRNGFKKIILVNGHGGNNSLVEFIAQTMLDQQKSYVLYYYIPDKQATDRINTLFTEVFHAKCFDDHGGEVETADTMANTPDWVKLNKESEVTKEQKRLIRGQESIPGEVSSPIWWYAYAPEHMAGQHADKATIEKGRKYHSVYAQELARFIKAVKDDMVGPALTKEFYKRTKSVGQ